MRICVAAVFFLLFAVPVVFATAAEMYGDGSIRCPFDEEKTENLADLKGGAAVASSNDKCVHETIELDIDAGILKITPTGSTRENTADACNKRDNCAVNKCGNVTFFAGGGKPCVISKCDPDYKEKVAKCVGGDTSVLKDYAVRDLVKDAITEDTPDERLQGLLEAFGVSEAQAKEVVEKDKAGVVDLLQKAALGDVTAAQVAAFKLGLNENLFNDVAFLKPEDRLNKFASALNEEQKQFGQKIVRGQETFAPRAAGSPPPPRGGGLPTQCGISSLAGNIMYAESRCGRINYNPLSSVQGPFHYLCSTWRADAIATGYGTYSGCSYRNDPIISARVVDARYTMHEQQYGSRCASGGLTWSSCAYAIHVFGEEGFRNILGAHYTNPNGSAYSLCGTAVSSAACRNNSSIFRNGGTIAGVFGELNKRLGGTSIISNVTTGGLPFGSGASIFGSGSPFSNTSPFSVLNGLMSGRASGNGGSPLGNMLNQFVSRFTGRGSAGLSSGGEVGGFEGSGFEGGSSVTSVSGISGGSAFNTEAIRHAQTSSDPITPRQTLLQALQEPVINSSVSNASLPVQADAAILVQPREITRGQSLTVSWSSVGMRASPACRVLLTADISTALVAERNEGSQILPTTASAEAGTWTFTLECIRLSDGQRVERTDSVEVQ